MAMAKFPSLSIAAAMGSWRETMGAYRLLHNPEVAPAALLAPHQEAVALRCAQHPCVVVAQDTTEFDFTHMTEMEGRGPLSDLQRRGCFLHSLYTLSSCGLPLGLWDLHWMVRTDAEFGSTGARKQKPIEDKESYRWVEGLRKTQALALRLPQSQVVSVSDREGDIYEVFALGQSLPQGPRAEWIIRSQHDRILCNVDADEALSRVLFAALAAAPVLGEIEFDLRARKGVRKVKGSTCAFRRSARKVRQQVRALEITPQVPYRRGLKLPAVTFWALLAEEVEVPQGEEPVRWVLLTSLPVRTLEEASRIMGLYLLRWEIEVFHRVLKTGCRVERIQLKDAHAVRLAMIIYAVIAWRILHLMHLGRVCPQLPCSVVFAEAEWRSVCAVVKRPPEAGEPTLGEMVKMVGRLGGHLGRKSDGPPGPQSMWQGLGRVRDFAYAWLALHSRPDEVIKNC